MFLQNTYSYIQGYSNIKIEGFFVERFVNLCISRNINIWDIRSENECISIFKIYNKDIEKLNEISNITRTQYKILDDIRNSINIKEI